MKRTRLSQSVMLVILLCLLTGLLLGGTGCPRTSTYLKILPRDTTVSTNHTFTLNVTLDPAPEHVIAGVQFDLSFNSTLLQAEGVDAGTFLSGPCSASFFREGTIDNEAGTITAVVDVVTDPGCVVSTVGTVATVTFKARLTTGTSQLRLTNTKVGNAEGDTLYSVPYTATVQVRSP